MWTDIRDRKEVIQSPMSRVVNRPNRPKTTRPAFYPSIFLLSVHSHGEGLDSDPPQSFTKTLHFPTNFLPPRIHFLPSQTPICSNSFMGFQKREPRLSQPRDISGETQVRDPRDRPTEEGEMADQEEVEAEEDEREGEEKIGQ